jgi:protein gp37
MSEVKNEVSEFCDQHNACREGKEWAVTHTTLADVFDNEAPAAWRAELFALIGLTPHLDWLLLTKRIGNVPAMLPLDWSGGYPNVWLGITVVDQAEADRDIAKLLAVPTVLRFLSMEPLLADVSLPDAGAFGLAGLGLQAASVDWVIAGGESGHLARPSQAAWYRSLRDQCAAAGVPFLFKQWGEWLPGLQDGNPARRVRLINSSDSPMRAGKTAAGRVLDSMTHDAFPEPPCAP